MPLRVTVIGTGYLGVTHAACLAESGFEVLGLDVDDAKIATLATGAVPFHEPSLDELVSKHVSTGRLRFTTSFAEAGAFGDVHYLCVGTPQRWNGLGADLGYLERAVDALAPHLRVQCLVVGKSTVPVGTAERLAGRLSVQAPANGDVELAWNPEFLREGRAVADTLRPDRIVVGVRSEIAEKVLRELYASQIDDGIPFIVTDVETAELVKVAANAFLATKVSFMNAMAELCEATGADVVALRDAIGRDERIGRRYLHAGLGFGGGCLPKDIRALMAQAAELGVGHAVAFLHEVDTINMSRRTRMVGLAREACDGTVLGKRIAVLGAAFKPDSDDVRDSPALNVAGQLQLQGATVCVYDPAARTNAERAFPSLHYSDSALAAAEGAHVVMHLTEWAEFRELDPGSLNSVVARKYILDGRNALDPERWRREGWTYRGLGRPLVADTGSQPSQQDQQRTGMRWAG
jgi:UDPglucose 6-dehydrogenase